MNANRDTSAFPSTQELRDWAMSKSAGRNLGRMGSLPHPVIAGWNKTHPERPFVKTEAFHGTLNGYLHRECRCDRCLLAGRTYESERYADRKWSA